jgi:mono/diheme cytochrome c family protein
MKIGFIVVLLLSSGAVSGKAQDGAALYRSKCLACHGVSGAGKAALNGTNLLADAARRATDADLTETIAHGGKNKIASHAYENKGLKAAEIQQLVQYIRTLQSKSKS